MDSGLLISLNKRCREILLKCNELDSDKALRALFTTKELRPFRNKIPDASNKSERVDKLLDYLIVNKLENGTNLLTAFLSELSIRYELGDGLRQDIIDLSCELRNIFKPDVSAELVNLQTLEYTKAPPLHFEVSQVSPQGIDTVIRNLDRLYHKNIINDEERIQYGARYQAVTTPVSYTHLTLPTTPYV